jgi:hypothetical protein
MISADMQLGELGEALVSLNALQRITIPQKQAQSGLRWLF